MGALHPSAHLKAVIAGDFRTDFGVVAGGKKSWGKLPWVLNFGDS